MTLADKISEERKKLRLSQEELAEKLSVSRQAVSKWESAQAIPDLQRIVQMSELFSVTTDYLLKDDEAKPACGESCGEKRNPDRRLVGMEEANAFCKVREDNSKRTALGVFLCIMSPVLLILLAGIADEESGFLSEKLAAGIGLVALFGLIALAVFLFVRSGMAESSFEYLEEESFDTAYGVEELIKEKTVEFQSIYVKSISLGVILCVLSPLPLILGALLEESASVLVLFTGLLLFTVAVGVYLIVRVSIKRSGYELLLQIGDHNTEKKDWKNQTQAISSIYWCLVTAGFLLWSFITDDWGRSWLIWPIAGVFYGVIDGIAHLLIGSRKTKKE